MFSKSVVATIFLNLSYLSASNAFVVMPSSQQSTLVRSSPSFVKLPMAATAEDTTEGEPTLSIYERVGFTEENIAIGIDPEEVLMWLGTRDQLIQKFVSDNPKFDEEKATEEVDRFMMDGEMVSKYIEFEKKKADPSNIKDEAEATLSDPKTWATYAAWIIGGAGFAAAKNLYIEPKYASGEWEEIKITLPEPFWLQKGAEEVASSTEAVQTTLDAVQTTVDAVVN